MIADTIHMNMSATTLQAYGSIAVNEQKNEESNTLLISQTNDLHRHLSLFDLVCVGIGATVGSGVFVLIGLIAHTQAGPAVSLSWLLAGISACFSGLCYAELGGRYPSVGSTYIYAKETMNEYAAVIAGACLTLEYTGSASAVARSWGDKVIAYIRTWEDDAGDNSVFYRSLIFLLDPGFGINTCAFVVSFVSVLFLLKGIKESKTVTNFFSTLNIMLVLFMGVASLLLSKKENLIPFVPAQFGYGGVVRGATSSFFGYIGFDEICCISGEAINPTRDIPRAILITLLVVTSLYCVASIGLAGMVPYQHISETSGFPEGFRYRGYNFIAEITALGELMVLPLVVLVTIMAQPRLNYIMAMDGALPSIFARVDEQGNLDKEGIKIAGAVMITVATIIPFSYLDDLISSGILIAFTMTDTSVILVWMQQSSSDKALEKLLAVFHSLSFLTGLFLRNWLSTGATGDTVHIMTIICSILLFYTGYRITRFKRNANNEPSQLFLTPFVPTLPLCGCFVNIYLISQLELTGLLAIVGYVALAVFGYHYRI